jgi:TetR/AcrR family tetracycline transcriptional repressor
VSRPTNRETALTKSEIARVALEMVDRDGVDKFSMRLLAEALGVTTMAVYHHFENKAEVLQAAADQVWIEIAMAVERQDDPIEDIVQAMLTIRRTFERHGDVTTFAFASPTTEEAIHLSAIAATQMFERAGFRGEDVGRAYQAIATYTLGSALIHAERTILDRAIRRPVSDLASVGPAPVPEVGESEVAYRWVRAAMTDDPDLVRFEAGLREIVAGLVDRCVTRA